MLDNTLSELETAIRDLLQRNQRLSARTQALDQALQAARAENDTLQLSLMKQEEAGAGRRFGRPDCCRRRRAALRSKPTSMRSIP